jgi:hypothetical protein
LLPWDYAITAESSEGRRVTGALRLWNNSAADSGRYERTQRWVRVAEDDTVQHPLIGVTNIRFMGTTLDSDSTLDQLEKATNPVYPQVLVSRSVNPAEGVELTLLVETSVERDPIIEFTDGAGNGLHVVSAEAGSIRGFYRPWGMVGTYHDTGYFCAQLLRKP